MSKPWASVLPSTGTLTTVPPTLSFTWPFSTPTSFTSTPSTEDSASTPRSNVTVHALVVQLTLSVLHAAVPPMPSTTAAVTAASLRARVVMQTESNRRPPPEAVLRAFGAADAPVLLPGGQGATWRAGPLVLKAVTLPEETRWRAGVLADLADSDLFRVARPVPAPDGGWVV